MKIGVIVESVGNMVNVFWSGGLTYWISKDKVNSIKVKDLVKGKNYGNTKRNFTKKQER